MIFFLKFIIANFIQRFIYYTYKLTKLLVNLLAAKIN